MTSTPAEVCKKALELLPEYGEKLRICTHDRYGFDNFGVLDEVELVQRYANGEKPVNRLYDDATIYSIENEKVIELAIFELPPCAE